MPGWASDTSVVGRSMRCASRRVSEPGRASTIGWVTSGAFGHRVEQSLALGYVPAALADARSGFEIEIIGERRAATPLDAPPYDPSGARMRL